MAPTPGKYFSDPSSQYRSTISLSTSIPRSSHETREYGRLWSSSSSSGSSSGHGSAGQHNFFTRSPNTSMSGSQYRSETPFSTNFLSRLQIVSTSQSSTQRHASSTEEPSQGWHTGLSALQMHDRAYRSSSSANSSTASPS